MILCVDDHRDVGDMLCRLLGRAGYPCQWRGSGEEALEFIRNYAPEYPLLVLIDLMMPGMSGIETLKEIRSDPAVADRTVVMLSAGVDSSAREAAMALGAAAWVVKGIDGAGGFDSMLKRITEWYQRVGGASQHADTAD